ncbi:unnamed protein product [Fusarium graminearum]|uniref:Chromosome 4, complete genome n=1 Tax=Gibberella zeae (strain ATCC MYA-4620 / CBS 123657 / FGSC 9075 / NRRL 31084 / PH-1) TaxID=229533 RepID=I1S8B0_GIBZE|nr:hypothetical protein FGSG_13088 [Fusarium graminearum PH-1]ESU13407.1 hypothetical protein FGSG_13088 [Fusarium graminearum PH-1]EYB26644.1 hypothetical protein FG05_13088 [Fusarium graminearum]CEF83776.1 unnamed protein product [Fusarium graminearum]CZS73010.1 unnamed protein product [Fusarium graminearum]|eukprot:XP_011326914.1 hypothetical protein FGSG_13088 [Fusarium graminearum PH-1]
MVNASRQLGELVHPKPVDSSHSIYYATNQCLSSDASFCRTSIAAGIDADDCRPQSQNTEKTTLKHTHEVGKHRYSRRDMAPTTGASPKWIMIVALVRSSSSTSNQ